MPVTRAAAEQRSVKSLSLWLWHLIATSAESWHERDISTFGHTAMYVPIMNPKVWTNIHEQTEAMLVSQAKKGHLLGL